MKASVRIDNWQMDQHFDLLDFGVAVSLKSHYRAIERSADTDHIKV